MAKVRVLLVEDSLTMRRHLCEVVAADAELEIVGEAEDGKAAVELCARLRPDVIVMDMVLPVMSGLAATEVVMANCPTPILIVSASLNRADLFKTYEALAAGAVDVLDKPHGDHTDAAWEQRFLATLKLVSRVRVITHPRARLGSMGQPQRLSARVSHTTNTRASTYSVVAIGASTGGPGAIVKVLSGLPRGYAIPILLVLHISEPFGASFAEWLADQIGRPVASGVDGESLSAAQGQVRMAPPDRHLVVRDGRLRLTADRERHSCRPSVDTLFESVSQYRTAAVACLLTGMGRDGAAGLLQVRRAGGLTIAQDEASCVVYGMPREAVLLGAAERVLSLSEIGIALAALNADSMRKEP